MLLYIYIAIVGISAISSLVSFRLDYPFHLKAFSVLLLYTFFIELTTNPLLLFFKIGSNAQYNFFMLVEFCWYAFYYRQIIKSRAAKKAINIFLFSFPVFWYFAVFYVFGIGNWDSYVFIVGGCFTIILSGVYCYELFTQDELVKISKCTEFWIAIGLILFYACDVPYMGMYYYLYKHAYDVAINLKIILLLFDSTMYSLFTYAFICQINTKKL